MKVLCDLIAHVVACTFYDMNAVVDDDRFTAPSRATVVDIEIHSASPRGVGWSATIVTRGVFYPNEDDTFYVRKAMAAI